MMKDGVIYMTRKTRRDLVKQVPFEHLQIDDLLGDTLKLSVHGFPIELVEDPTTQIKLGMFGKRDDS